MARLIKDTIALAAIIAFSFTVIQYANDYTRPRSEVCQWARSHNVEPMASRC